MGGEQKVIDPFQAAIFNIGKKKQGKNHRMGNKKKELNREEAFQKVSDTDWNSASNISKVEMNDRELPDPS